MAIGLQASSPFHGWWEVGGGSPTALSTGDAGTHGAGTAVTSSTAGLVVAVISIGAGSGTPTVSSVTGAGSNWGAWNFIVRSNARASGNDDVELWYSVTTGAVNGVVTANFSSGGATAAADIRVFCFDANASTTPGVSAAASGANADVHINLPDVADSSVVLFGCTNYTNANVPNTFSDNATSTWTQAMTTNGGAYGQALTSPNPVAQDVFIQCTETSCTDWDAVIVEIHSAEPFEALTDAEVAIASDQSAFKLLRYGAITAFQSNSEQENAFQLGGGTGAPAADNKAEVDSSTATDIESNVLRGASAEVDSSTATDVESAAGKQTAAEIDSTTASDVEAVSAATQRTAEVDSATATDVEAALGKQQAAEVDTATALDSFQAYSGIRTAQIDAATALDDFQGYSAQVAAQVDVATATDPQGYAAASPGVDNKGEVDTCIATDISAVALAMAAVQVDTAVATDTESRTSPAIPPFSQVFFVWDGANWV